MAMLYSETLLATLTIGILPAIFWLLFWLYEDKAKPEPRGLIIRTFIFGMLVVPIVIPLQRLGFNYFSSSIVVFGIVSITEEIFKFLAAYFSSLSNKENNEPLDPVIYMITSALGFAALENTLFLIQEAQTNSAFSNLLISGNLRFMGATLLHVISSATVGVFLSLSFYRSRRVKSLFLLFGLILAIILHTVFNLLIINSVNTNIFTIFTLVWIGVVILLLMFEKIKTIKRFRRK